MTTTIKGPALERMKQLVENPRDSLTPKPSWHPDPRSVMEQPRQRKRYDPLSYMDELIEEQEGYDIFGNYD